MDGVVVVASGACAGALAVASPVAAGLGAAVVLSAFVLVARERRRRATVVAFVAALAFVASAWRGQVRVEQFRRARASLSPPTGMIPSAAAPWPARCEGEGEVVRSPAWLGGLRIDIVVDEGTCTPEREGRGGVIAGAHVAMTLADDTVDVARHDRVRFVAQLAPVHVLRNPGATEGALATWANAARRDVVLSGTALDVRVTRSSRAPPAHVDHVRAHVRRRIRATFPKTTEAMARALVLGEDDVAPEDRRAFQASGLSHLLAVSGMHLVIVVAGLVAGVHAILVRFPSLASSIEPGRLASAAGIPLAFVYADLAGGSGSAARAAFMMAVALGARVLARRSSAWRALGLSVLAMVIGEPLAPFDLSFALSVTATLGLLVVSRPIDAALASRLPPLLAWTRAPMAATAGASVACAPLLALMSPEMPVASVLANVVAVPIGEMLALPLCLAHALLGMSADAERGCALAAGGALDLVRLIARAFAAIPGAALACPAPTAVELAIAATAVGLVAVSALRARSAVVLAASALVFAEGLACRRAAPRDVLRVTFLDVAQGDAALVDLPDGSAMLVDGGGLVGSPFDVGERVLAPVLRARRRDALSAVVLSHPHPDHFLGLGTGLARVAIGSFWDTGQGEAEGAGEAYAALLTALRGRGVPVERPPSLCGTREVGGARIDVLAPCPGPDTEHGPNDNSFVLRLTYGARSILFVGDAERAEETRLVGSLPPGALRADVLKVGHHGSRTSSSAAFVAAVAPSVAVVSSGVRNRFGHPHPPTLATLAHASVRIHRTDLDGAVTVTTDGTGLAVTTVEDAW